MASSSRSPHKPNLIWRLFVLIGLTTLGVLSVSDPAWEAWKQQVGTAMDRNMIRRLFYGSLILHVGEAFIVWRKARKHSFGNSGKWAINTLIYGYPVFRRASKQAKQLAKAAD